MLFIVSGPGRAIMPEPQTGPEEQSTVHPGPSAGHVPASPHHPVTLRRQDGNTR